MNQEVVFSARGLHKYFGNLHVLSDIHMEVKQSEILTILGPSGCGKTTLLRIANGLIPYDQGEVLYRSERIDRPRTEMVMVFQHFGLFPWKKLHQNIAYGLKLRGVPPKEVEEAVAHYTDLVGLNGFEDHYPAQLSGGMQQRVGLARALATKPQVLLLDEPFGALDALTREQLQEELLRINDAEPKTMLFITHSIDEALLLGDRVVLMTPQPGRIRFEVKTGFGRNRDLEAIRASSRFHALRHHLWELLRNPDDEVDEMQEFPAYSEERAK